MSEKQFECVFKEHETKNSWSMIKDNQLDKPLYIKDVVDLLNELSEENEHLLQSNRTLGDNLKQEEEENANEYNALLKENEKLRQMIKENVFQRYREGSLADLEFKAIAYDDIVKLEVSNESEPKVIVICRQGKKENVKSFCQMFIPFGMYYEIREVIE